MYPARWTERRGTDQIASEVIVFTFPSPDLGNRGYWVGMWAESSRPSRLSRGISHKPTRPTGYGVVEAKKQKAEQEMPAKAAVF